MGAIFSLSLFVLQSTSISPRGAFMSGSPVFMAATQGILLDYLALVASKACIPGFYGIVTNSLWLTNISREPVQREDWNVPPVSLWKKHSWDRSQWMTCCIPLPSHFRWLVSPRKDLVHLSSTLIFVTTLQGTLLDHLALAASRIYTCDLTELYVFVYLKSCCLRIQLPVNLNLGADWDLPLWDIESF